jgi:hypothetical protein
MGYRAWQALGHQVRRGESSIKILAPCLYKTRRADDDREPTAGTTPPAISPAPRRPGPRFRSPVCSP